MKCFFVLAPLTALLWIGSPQTAGPGSDAAGDARPDLDKILTGDFSSPLVGAPPPADSLHIVDWNIDRGTRLDHLSISATVTIGAAK